MAKRKNLDTSANDYIDQLHWKSRHSRRFLSVHYEPKWKYKVVYRFPATTRFGRMLQTAVLIGLVLLIIDLVLSGRMGESIEEKAFYGIVFALMITITQCRIIR